MLDILRISSVEMYYLHSNLYVRASLRNLYLENVRVLWYGAWGLLEDICALATLMPVLP